MVIKLYIDYGSQPARAVLAFCMIAKIPYDVVETRIFKFEVVVDVFRTEARSSRRSTR